MNPFTALRYGALLLACGFANADTPIPPPKTAIPTSETTAPFDRSTLKYSNKWRITFNHEAKNDGILVFRMAMKHSNAEPITVSIPIKKGTSENRVARNVKRALQHAFPRDFNVETDDNESVLVKLNLIEGVSSVTLVSSDIRGLKIKISKE